MSGPTSAVASRSKFETPASASADLLTQCSDSNRFDVARFLRNVVSLGLRNNGGQRADGWDATWKPTRSAEDKKGLALRPGCREMATGRTGTYLSPHSVNDLSRAISGHVERSLTLLGDLELPRPRCRPASETVSVRPPRAKARAGRPDPAADCRSS